MLDLTLQTNVTPQQKYYFEDAGQALAEIEVYKERLSAFAQEYKSTGKALTDQCYPNELFALRPLRASLPPLLLLGGMGPLAGADGFANACRRFGNSREIVLLQACTVPDRTQVVISDDGIYTAISSQRMLLISMLRGALEEAAMHVGSEEGEVRFIVLCNTSHCFMPEVLRELHLELPQVAARLRLISLVESAIARVKRRAHRKVLALYTEGTRLSRIYSRRLRAEGINFIEPSGALEELLMSSIFQGVKAFDEELSLRAAESFFEELLRAEPHIDCILAGCTELPYVLEKLREGGSARVRRFLAEVEVVDPAAAALSLA